MNDPARQAACAFRAAAFYFLDEPDERRPWDALRYVADALLVVRDGRIADFGPAAELMDSLHGNVEVIDRRDKLIAPGLVDAHVHYVQTDIVASYGRRLLDWLNEYTYPAEAAFADAQVAEDGAARFLSELWRNGTTSALVMASSDPVSVEALFAAAHASDMRLVAGKTMMDRNCPDALRDSAADSYAQSRALIDRWHGRGRLGYAVSPRFAPTSTSEQLTAAGRLLAEHDGVLLHTHLAENPSEIAWVTKLFPDCASYLDVYASHGLVGERSVMAHCLHMDMADRERFAASGATAVLCPTSNLFLGSGLFDLAAADAAGMRLAVGTDVGAGPTFSLLHTLAAAYGVTHTAGKALHPARAWYLATLGGARALGAGDAIGSLAPAREADFIVLDPAATPLLSRRIELARGIEETLFALLMLGDDRAIFETYLAGRRVHARDAGAAH